MASLQSTEISNPREELSIGLADGRRLGYAEYGSKEGPVLMYFHGLPGSRESAQFLAHSANNLGVRLIGVDRPGVGLSSFNADRSILNWTDDVSALADQLSIERFSVVGQSGGGVFALACAYGIPERLIACGVTAGSGKLNWIIRYILRSTAPISLRAFGKMASSRERALRTIESHSRRWPPADREALQGELATVLAASLVGAFAQGPAGVVQEARLLTRDWGFELEHIRCRRLFWWHGIRDTHVPIAIARATWSRLDGCVTRSYPDDGHISLLVNHGDEIVRRLTEP